MWIHAGIVVTSVSLCRWTRRTAECVSWSASWKKQRRRWLEPTPTVGSFRGSLTKLQSQRMLWTVKSALWRASSGRVFILWGLNVFVISHSVYVYAVFVQPLICTKIVCLFFIGVEISICDVSPIAPALKVMKMWTSQLRQLRSQLSEQRSAMRKNPIITSQYGDAVKY